VGKMGVSESLSCDFVVNSSLLICRDLNAGWIRLYYLGSYT